MVQSPRDDMTVIGRDRFVPQIHSSWMLDDREAARSTECHVCRGWLDRAGAHWFCPACRASRCRDSFSHRELRAEVFGYLDFRETDEPAVERAWRKAYRGEAMYG